MITIDAPISFLLGSGIALATINSDSDKQKINQVFSNGLILQSCVLTPVILFFMLRFPDWEWNYLFNAKAFFFSDSSISLGAMTMAIIVALLNASFILGFKVSERLLINDNKKAVQLILAITGFIVAVIMLIMFKQSINIGSLEEFNNGSAELIFMNRDFLIAQSVAGILLAAGFLFIVKKSSTEQ